MPSNNNQKENPPSTTKWSRIFIPWFIALVGVAASVLAFRQIHLNQELRTQKEFERRAQSTTNLMEVALGNQLETLRTLQELFHCSEEVSRDEFERAAQQLIERHTGIESLKWAPRVQAGQRERFEKAAQAEGIPAFEIFESSPAGTPSVAPSRKEHFPVFFSAPFDRDPRALGFDLPSSPAWADFQIATREGDVRASGPVRFVTKADTDGEYLVELPVFGDAIPRTEIERVSLLRGFILGVFRPSAILEKLMTQVQQMGIDVLMVDRISSQDLRVLHFHPSVLRHETTEIPTIANIELASHYHSILPFAGRAWELWFRPAPEWLASQRNHDEYIIALFILLITALIALYFNSVFRQTTEIESLVARRTAELTATQRELRDDIRQRMETEQALKASEERYRSLVSQSTDAIWRLELSQPIAVTLPHEEQIERILATGHIAECNEITAQMHGRKLASEILGQHLAFLSPHATQPYAASLRAFVRNSYRLAEHESSDTTPSGETRIFVHNLIGVLENERLVRIWVTERELTQQRMMEGERHAFERRLGETQRLESLGVLAGGIAHDFNNLLTGIMGHASLGRCEIPADSPLSSHFEQIEAASRSAASLCQQMLAYAGKGRFVVKPYNLSLIVSQAAHLLHISVSKQAELRFQLAENLPYVKADAAQIQQIVMNLVTNASEAISQRSGVITLTSGVIKPDATTFSDCPYAPSKLAPSYVFLEVRDNGCGIPTELRSRVFEPFFTTKFAGRGLGLAAALGIVRGHAGALRVESKVGSGSAFTLYLPVMDPQPQIEVVPAGVTNTPWRADGALLVIDDEAPVRSVTERMAQTIGFSALCAADGDQGIQLFQLYRSSIKVVLLDLSMPGLSGEETLAGLRAIDPEVRVIMMSGYSQPELSASIIGKTPTFLSKPFSIAQFQTAIRQTIAHQ